MLPQVGTAVVQLSEQCGRWLIRRILRHQSPFERGFQNGLTKRYLVAT